jgi:tellurite methyltransferase
VARKDAAIDLGGGALRETRLLLDLGFFVTVVDTEPSVASKIADLKCRRLTYFFQSFDDFNFPFEMYDLAVALNSLPFSSPNTFERTIKRLKQSLKPGAIFCGTLFGVNDDWNKLERAMTFLTRSAVESLFNDMDVIKLDERYYLGLTAAGTKKHWHVFEIIAKKKYVQ